MKDGIIIKGVGGFYYVKTSDGIYTCKAKGSFRKGKSVPCVGDSVSIREINDKEGFIEIIKERKNHLIRPPVSNIDRMIVISSVDNPKPDTVFIDKMIAICEYNHIELVICFNKIDLSEDLSICKAYEKIGYKTVSTSVKDNIGLNNISDFLVDGITAVSGFSGVGKSSIINTIVKEKVLTGSISEKSQRGKHTTRHVELYHVSDGKFFADTPGFSDLDIDMIKKDELADLFIDFLPYKNQCMFNDCSHTKEKGCKVIEAVNNNKIEKFRHENYCYFYDKLKLINDWERK